MQSSTAPLRPDAASTPVTVDADGAPCVTVIVTFYNQQQWVESALDSVRAQTADNIQLIITDDGSTDGTAGRIDAWCERFAPEAVVVRPPQNVGLPAVLNLAAASARGEFLMILNGDDQLTPDRVERQAAALMSAPPEVGVVVSDLVCVDEAGNPTGARRPDGSVPVPEGDILRRFIAESVLPGSPGLMVRRSLLETIGPWDEDLAADDFDFVLRLAQVTHFRYVPFDAAIYRIHGDSLTRKVGLMADNRATALLRLRGDDREIDALIDRRVGQLASAMHEHDYRRNRTRQLLLLSLWRTHRPKCVRQLAGSLGRSTLSPFAAARRTLTTVRRLWPRRRIEAVSSPILGSLAAVIGGSMISGLLEASLLVIVASVATTLTGTEGAAIPVIGPLSVWLETPGILVGVGFGILAAYAAIEVAVGWVGARLVARTTYEVRNTVLERYARATWASKESLEGTALVQLATSNATKVGGSINDVVGIVAAGSSFLILIAAALVVDPVAAVFVVAAVAVVMTATIPLTVIAGRKQRELADASRAYLAEVQQLSALTREVEVFGVQTESLHTADEINRSQARLVGQSRFYGRVNTTIFKTSGLVLVLGLLATVLATDASDIARLSAVALVLLRSVSYGQGVQRSWHQINETAPWFDQLERDLALFDPVTPGPAVAPPRAATPLELRLDGLSFRYDETTPVIEDLNFTFEAGQCVGIVGPSGAGKSTLAELLLGLREPTSGRILADGIDREEISRHEWAGSIAWVRQEPVLIRGSILENVRFHRPWVTDEMARQALAEANILDEILGWPAGLATDPGTLGAHVSGGQKQRIAIARALAGKPRMLILDEPTSALDEDSETRVTEALARQRGEVTIAVIAHRPTTLASCDTLLRLGPGIEMTPR